MTKLGLLMISCAAISTIPACIADSPAEDAEQSQVTEAERATPDVAAFSGAFGPIRLTNTSFCLQPQGGSTGDVLVELRFCNGSSAQSWLLSPTSGGTTIINQQSGKCLYNNAPLPLFDKGQPMTHESCFISGTSRIASNALWKPTTTAGETTFMSRVQVRDTGFCLDVPFGQAFDTATLQIFHCNNTSAQKWIVN
jgi:hypothetical protein